MAPEQQKIRKKPLTKPELDNQSDPIGDFFRRIFSGRSERSNLGGPNSKERMEAERILKQRQVLRARKKAEKDGAIIASRREQYQITPDDRKVVDALKGELKGNDGKVQKREQVEIFQKVFEMSEVDGQFGYDTYGRFKMSKVGRFLDIQNIIFYGEKSQKIEEYDLQFILERVKKMNELIPSDELFQGKTKEYFQLYFHILKNFSKTQVQILQGTLADIGTPDGDFGVYTFKKLLEKAKKEGISLEGFLDYAQKLGLPPVPPEKPDELDSILRVLKESGIEKEAKQVYLDIISNSFYKEKLKSYAITNKLSDSINGDEFAAFIDIVKKILQSDKKEVTQATIQLFLDTVKVDLPKAKIAPEVTVINETPEQKRIKELQKLLGFTSTGSVDEETKIAYNQSKNAYKNIFIIEEFFALPNTELYKTACLLKKQETITVVDKEVLEEMLLDAQKQKLDSKGLLKFYTQELAIKQFFEKVKFNDDELENIRTFLGIEKSKIPLKREEFIQLINKMKIQDFHTIELGELKKRIIDATKITISPVAYEYVEKVNFDKDVSGKLRKLLGLGENDKIEKNAKGFKITKSDNSVLIIDQQDNNFPFIEGIFNIENQIKTVKDIKGFVSSLKKLSPSDKKMIEYVLGGKNMSEMFANFSQSPLSKIIPLDVIPSFKKLSQSEISNFIISPLEGNIRLEPDDFIFFDDEKHFILIYNEKKGKFVVLNDMESPIFKEFQEYFNFNEFRQKLTGLKDNQLRSFLINLGLGESIGNGKIDRSSLDYFKAYTVFKNHPIYNDYGLNGIGIVAGGTLGNLQEYFSFGESGLKEEILRLLIQSKISSSLQKKLKAAKNSQEFSRILSDNYSEVVKKLEQTGGKELLDKLLNFQNLEDITKKAGINKAFLQKLGVTGEKLVAYDEDTGMLYIGKNSYNTEKILSLALKHDAEETGFDNFTKIVELLKGVYGNDIAEFKNILQSVVRANAPIARQILTNEQGGEFTIHFKKNKFLMQAITAFDLFNDVKLEYLKKGNTLYRRINNDFFEQKTAEEVKGMSWKNIKILGPIAERIIAESGYLTIFGQKLDITCENFNTPAKVSYPSQNEVDKENERVHQKVKFQDIVDVLKKMQDNTEKLAFLSVIKDIVSDSQLFSQVREYFTKTAVNKQGMKLEGVYSLDISKLEPFSKAIGVYELFGDVPSGCIKIYGTDTVYKKDSVTKQFVSQNGDILTLEKIKKNPYIDIQASPQMEHKVLSDFFENGVLNLEKLEAFLKILPKESSKIVDYFRRNLLTYGDSESLRKLISVEKKVQNTSQYEIDFKNFSEIKKVLTPLVLFKDKDYISIIVGGKKQYYQNLGNTFVGLPEGNKLDNFSTSRLVVSEETEDSIPEEFLTLKGKFKIEGGKIILNGKVIPFPRFIRELNSRGRMMTYCSRTGIEFITKTLKLPNSPVSDDAFESFMRTDSLPKEGNIYRKKNGALFVDKIYTQNDIEKFMKLNRSSLYLLYSDDSGKYGRIIGHVCPVVIDTDGTAWVLDAYYGGGRPYKLSKYIELRGNRAMRGIMSIKA